MQDKRSYSDRDLGAHMPSCDHNDEELRTHVIRSGVKHYKFQCLTCGSRGGSIRRDHWLIQTLKVDPPAVDLDLSTKWWAARQAEQQEAYENARRAERDAWRDRYNTYLKSPEWRGRVEKVMQRDRNVCRADLLGCARFATQVHHLTYDHLGHEPLFDLIAICAPCHARLTALDRERRTA